MYTTGIHRPLYFFHVVWVDNFICDVVMVYRCRCMNMVMRVMYDASYCHRIANLSFSTKHKCESDSCGMCNSCGLVVTLNPTRIAAGSCHEVSAAVWLAWCMYHAEDVICSPRMSMLSADLEFGISGYLGCGWHAHMSRSALASSWRFEGEKNKMIKNN